MTDFKPLPSAARILGEAISIALDPSSGDLTLRRGELLYSIARELREDAQYRRTSERLHASLAPIITSPTTPPPADGADIEANLRKFAAQFRAGADPVMMTGINRLHFDAWAQARPEPSVGAGVTQRIPVIWTVGDKAQCRNCHTPIELHEVAVESAAEPPAVWRHKYTGQATCAVATMSSDGLGEATHTFAEPE